MPETIRITDMEDEPLTIVPLDAMGNLADTTDYPITDLQAMSSDPSIATVEPDPDAADDMFRALVKTTGKEGDVQISFIGTVTDRSGPHAIQGQSPILRVGPGEATSFTATFGTPRERLPLGATAPMPVPTGVPEPNTVPAGEPLTAVSEASARAEVGPGGMAPGVETPAPTPATAPAPRPLPEPAIAPGSEPPFHEPSTTEPEVRAPAPGEETLAEVETTTTPREAAPPTASSTAGEPMETSSATTTEPPAGEPTTEAPPAP